MSFGIPPRYEPTGQSLAGGMGEIIICMDRNLEREIAIKFIQDVKDQRRLFDEIAALQKIRSKHVVQVFDVFINELDRKVGIIQEYLPGEDLTCFEGDGIPTTHEYLKVLFQIISGIADIHLQGIIHRDIKPNNMKFDQSSIVKIFDFGLARFSSKNDSTLGFTGTLGFSAPELFRSGLVTFDETIDVYSFGVVAWYLSGASLPPGLSKMPPTLDDFPGFSYINLAIPEPIAEILDRTLSQYPEERPIASDIRDLIGNHLLFGKHRGLLISGETKYVIERVNQVTKLNVQNYGSVHIKYDGLQFLIDFVDGSVFVNNQRVVKGSVLPKDCVITLGDAANKAARLFITFDISNPEVVL